MIIPPAVHRKFSYLQGFVQHVGQEVRGVVASYCEEHGYAFVSRYKTLASLAEKIESGRYACWSDLDDLYAATIVVPTLSEEPAALDFLERQFEKIAIRARGATRKAPEVFRFDATRFIGCLRKSAPIQRAPDIDHIRFEVQVRTAFEHAWSVTTHARTFKSDVVDWRRLRLVAQLKAAVEQLDTLVLAFNESAPRITEFEWPDVVARQNIAETFKRCVSEGLLPDELVPKDWSRFSENVHGVIRAGSVTRSHARHDSIADTEKALVAIQDELRSMPPTLVPRSLSLFQLTLGILAKRRLLGNDFQQYFPNVTDELRFLYPEVNQFRSTFNYEDLSCSSAATE